MLSFEPGVGGLCFVVHPLELSGDLYQGFVPRLGNVEPHKHGSAKAEHEEDEEAEKV